MPKAEELVLCPMCKQRVKSAPDGKETICTECQSSFPAEWARVLESFEIERDLRKTRE